MKVNEPKNNTMSTNAFESKGNSREQRMDGSKPAFMFEPLAPFDYDGIVKRPEFQPQDFSKPAPKGFEINWNGFTKIEDKEGQPVNERGEIDAAMMVGVDDNALISVGWSTVHIPGYGPEGGGQYREKSGSVNMKPGYYYPANLWYENINYSKPKENVAIFKARLNGDPVILYDVFPKGQEPEKDFCECPCVHDKESEGGAPVLASSFKSLETVISGKMAQSPLASSGGGSRTTATSDEDSMLWRANFGVLRGIHGIPGGYLELIRFDSNADDWHPRSLAYRHPVASLLQLPAGGLVPNGMMLVHSGKARRAYLVNGNGSAIAPMGASSLRGECVQMLTEQMQSAGHIQDASYLRVLQKDKSACLYSIRTGVLVNYTTPFLQTISMEELQSHLDVKYDSQGVLRQVWNTWDGLLNVENITETGYTLAMYLPSQVTGLDQENNFYAVEGLPFKTYLISGNSETGRTTITEQSEGRMPYRTTWWNAGKVWNMIQGEGDEAVHVLRERTENQDQSWTIVTRMQSGAEGTPVSVTAETWRNSAYGPQCLSRTNGYGSTQPMTVRYSYDGSGRRISETAPDGSGIAHGYAVAGRIRAVHRPWAGGDERIDYTYYRDEAGNDGDIAYTRAVLVKNDKPTQLSRTDYTYHEEDHVRRVERRSIALGSPHTRLEVAETWLGTAPEPLNRGRVRMTQAVDGTQKWYGYDAVESHGAIYSITEETRVEGNAVPGQSTRSVSFIDAAGNTVHTEEYALAGSGRWCLLDSSDYIFDRSNQWCRRTRANGRVTERENMCCGLLWERNEDGVTTRYAYDSLRRQVESIRDATEITPETIISRTHDAMGHVLKVQTDIGPMSTMERSAYDPLGRLSSGTDILGRTSQWSYDANGLTETLTTPAGATLVTRRHADGTILERSGSGQRNLLEAVDLVDDGVRTVTRTAAAEGGVMLRRVVVNGFGEMIRDATQNAAGGSNYLNRQFNFRGQLARQQTDELAPELYEYDGMGNMIRHTMALSDTPDVFNSRVVEYGVAFEQKEDEVYQVERQTVYNENGLPVVSETAELVSMTTGTVESKTVKTDVRGNQMVRWTVYGQGSSRNVYIKKPASEREIMLIVTDGFTTRETNEAGITRNISFSFTAFGLVENHVDARGNLTVIERDTGGREIQRTDAAGNVTVTAYDHATGQVASITDALGHIIQYTYDKREQKITESGTGMYPVRYSYNENGLLVSMETWRYPGKNLTDIDDSLKGDVTRWEYAVDTGLMVHKIYADGRYEDYSYDGNNRLNSVTQSRGIKSAYAYAPLTGELVSVTHDDGTPGETRTYNHIGQLVSVTDASGTRRITYNEYREKDGEVTEGLVSSFLTFERDSLGRPSGKTMTHNRLMIQKTQMEYDTAGRLGRDGEYGLESYTYDYDVVSGFLKTVSYPNGLVKTFGYLCKRNLVANIDYQRTGSANSPAKTEYDYDDVMRPIAKRDYWNTAKPGRTHTYSYNTRNELTADNMQPGERRSYSYDNIGNRKDIAEPSRNIHYTTTQLNQYSAITPQGQVAFVPQYDADGNQTCIKTGTGEWDVSYNANNRPVIFEQDGRKITCVYDYMGRRIEKAVWNNGILLRRQRFIYNGYLQIAEIDALDEMFPKVIQTYFWDTAESVATRVLHLTVWNMDGIPSERLYFTHDAQKNTLSLFGQKAGRRAQYEYDPYGILINSTGDAAGINPFRYSCEYHDEDLGLIYYNYRHYNPADGRWINRDPIAEAGGYNVYGFVKNQASSKIDDKGYVECKDESGTSQIAEYLKNLKNIVQVTPQSSDDFVQSSILAFLTEKYPKGTTLFYSRSSSLSRRLWESPSMRNMRKKFDRLDDFCKKNPKGFYESKMEVIGYSQSAGEFVPSIILGFGPFDGFSNSDMGIQNIGSFIYRVAYIIDCENCMKSMLIFAENDWTVASMTRVPLIRFSLITTDYINPLKIVIQISKSEKIKNCGGNAG